jgi:hypothetical protein
MSVTEVKSRSMPGHSTATGDGSAPAQAAVRQRNRRSKPRIRHNRSQSPPAAAAAAAAGSDCSASDSDERAAQPAPARVPRRHRPLAKGKISITKSVDTGYRLMVRRRAMEAAELAAQRAFVDTHYAYGLAAPDPAALVCRILMDS